MAPNEDDHKYHFTLTKPSTIQIRLSSSANADLFLIESSGRGIPHGEIIGKSTKGYGKNEFQFIYTIPDELIYTLPAGDYEIRVRSAEKNYAFLYELSTQTLYFDNRPPPGTTRLTAIDLGDFSSAKVLQYTKIQTLEPETGDDDRFYRFTLTEDRGMVISVNHRNTDNADLSLLDASGRTLRHSANFGTNSEWLYPTLTKGTYFVRVDAPFGETVKYQLGYASYFPRNLGDLAHLEPGDILTETGEFHGTASYDGLRFFLTERRTMQFDLHGLTESANLRLIDVTWGGSVIHESTYSEATGHSLTRTLDAGAYSVLVENQEAGYQPYQLAMERKAWSPAAPVVDLGDINGRVRLPDEDGDVNLATNPDDYFRFTLNGTRRVSIGLTVLEDSEDVSDTAGVAVIGLGDVVSAMALDDMSATMDNDVALPVDPDFPDFGDLEMGGGAETVERVLPIIGLSLLDSEGREIANSEPDFVIIASPDGGSNGSVTIASLDDDSKAVGQTLEAGTYFIRVGASKEPSLASGKGSDIHTAIFFDNAGTGPVDYRLHFNFEPWSPPESTVDLGNVTNLANHRSRAGAIDIDGAIDIQRRHSSRHYRFELTQASDMTIVLENPSGDVDLFLLDSSGRELDSSTNPGTTADALYPRLEAGTYYLRVEAPADPPGTFRAAVVRAPISYRLRYGLGGWTPPGLVTDLGNLTGLTSFRTESDSVRLETDRHDYYRFELTEARGISFELNFSGSAGPGRDEERVLISRQKLAQAEAKVEGLRIELTMSEMNVDTLTAELASAGWDDPFLQQELARAEMEVADLTVRLVAAELEVAALTNDLAQAEAEEAAAVVVAAEAELALLPEADLATLDTTTDGMSSEPTVTDDAAADVVLAADVLAEMGIFEVQPEDLDITLFPNPDVVLTGAGGEPSPDADLVLLDSSGREIVIAANFATVTSRDGAGDSLFRTLDAGTYYLRVDARSGGTVDYRLRYGPAATDKEGPFTPETVDLGDLTEANRYFWRTDSVSVGEDDLYRFTLAEARGVWMFMDDLSADADLSLLNSSGQELAASRNGDTYFDSLYPALDPGTYYIRVNAVADGDIDYALSNPTFPLADLGDLTSLTADHMQQGAVAWQDNALDGFRFTLTDTRTLYFELHGLNADSDVDLHLFKISGEFIDNSTRGAGAIDRIVRELDAGAYYVAVDAREDGLFGYKLHYGSALTLSPNSAAPTQPLWRNEMAPALRPDERKRQFESAGGLLAV